MLIGDVKEGKFPFLGSPIPNPRPPICNINLKNLVQQSPIAISPFFSPANQVAKSVSIPTNRMAPADEAELIGKAQHGDVEAFCVLASRHQRAMYAVAFRLCRDHHDAEDLVQDAFLNAFRAIGQFKGMSSFYAWIRRIMLNLFLNGKRKTRLIEDVTAGAGHAIPGSERVTFNRVLAQQILERLESFPARQRLMFILKHQEGLTCQEIAEQFDTTTGTVKKTLFRMVAQLREKFQTPRQTCTIVKNSVKS